MSKGDYDFDSVAMSSRVFSTTPTTGTTIRNQAKYNAVEIAPTVNERGLHAQTYYRKEVQCQLRRNYNYSELTIVWTLVFRCSRAKAKAASAPPFFLNAKLLSLAMSGKAAFNFLE